MLDFVPPPRFRLVRRIGAGGMGVVHEAIDRERNVRVALKVLRADSVDSILRFKREFRALQDLQHPNLVSLGELVSEGTTWFFTMELVEGDDFVSWIARDDARPGEAMFDETRLRAGLEQLAHALAALHAAGKVHRDIKPSNVLVARDGRVVVLDFGLVTETMGSSDGSTTELDVVGTPAYMAPEQAASRPVGPAADWYSVGALLHEAITGEPPFVGATLEVLMRKQRDEPQRPSARGFAAPPDLEELCVRLLRIEPQSRPDARRVLEMLGAGAPKPRASMPSMPSVTAHAVFVGREGEMTALRDAYAASRANGAPASVLVHGESGIGKSCLVRRFADAQAMQERELLVVAGRCHERETVPYKAFDGVVDALTRTMARMSAADVEPLVPLRPGPLMQVFPVFRRVESIARLGVTQHSRLDPHELRSRAFGAFRELFLRICDRRPLIVIVDDLQWADADSVALLAELMRPPDAPALLFVGTIRTVPDVVVGEGTVNAKMAVHEMTSEAIEASLAGDVRHLRLERLDEGHARALTEQLVARVAPGLPVDAATIAREADGHPLFIDEIVRHLLLVGAPASTTLRLDDALWSRVCALGAEERRLVEIVCMAGAPLAQDAAARALGAEPLATARIASLLRVAHLCRTTGARGSDTIEPYHARIRAAVLARLDGPSRRELHQRIALALETSQSPDPEALAMHWLGAHDLYKAAKYMLAAADRASEALAFDRAATLYAKALELRARTSRKSDRDEERAQQTKLADALAKAGAGARAARAYRDAAMGANAADAIDLQRRAAEQLLRSGHFDEGLAAIKTVLASIGMSLPERPWAALLAVVWWRFVLALRGLRFRAVDPSAIAQRDLTRCDILWSVAFALSLVDIVNSQLFQARCFLFSLRLGDRHRLARALANEIAISAQAGGRGWARTEALVARTTALMKDTQDPLSIGWTRGTTAAALYLNGRFREGLESADEAVRTFREETVGTAWEITTVQLFALQSLAQLGELRELARRVPLAVREANDRGDLYATVNFRIGHPNLAWLIAGDVDGARRNVATAMKQWSKRGLHLEHYFELYALTNADLYAGDATQAHARAEERVRALRWALVTRVQAIRINVWHVRARAALAVAAADASRAATLARTALADARRIEAERMAWGAPLATLVRAGAARVRGDLEPAAMLLARAVEESRAAGMALHENAARWTLGDLRGGDEGRALRAEADAWMKRETVRDPAALVAMIAPGFRS